MIFYELRIETLSLASVISYFTQLKKMISYKRLANVCAVRGDNTRYLSIWVAITFKFIGYCKLTREHIKLVKKEKSSSRNFFQLPYNDDVENTAGSSRTILVKTQFYMSLFTKSTESCSPNNWFLLDLIFFLA